MSAAKRQYEAYGKRGVDDSGRVYWPAEFTQWEHTYRPGLVARLAPLPIGPVAARPGERVPSHPRRKPVAAPAAPSFFDEG